MFPPPMTLSLTTSNLSSSLLKKSSSHSSFPTIDTFFTSGVIVPVDDPPGLMTFLDPFTLIGLVMVRPELGPELLIVITTRLPDELIDSECRSTMSAKSLKDPLATGVDSSFDGDNFDFLVELPFPGFDL